MTTLPGWPGDETNGFMYLEIRVNSDRRLSIEEVVATVKKSGELVRPSVGAENTRWGGPIQIIAIDRFDGIEVIDTDSLIEELERRMNREELRRRLRFDTFTKEEILKALEDLI